MQLENSQQKVLDTHLQAMEEVRARKGARLREVMEANRVDGKLFAASEEVVTAILASHHGVLRIEIGSWDCKESPIGICYYDPDGDYSWDECLVCGNPHERK